MTRRRLAVDLSFFTFFGLYAISACGILAQGALAAVASAVPSFHQEMHLRGLGTGMTGRTALRIADAAHHVQPAPQLALDFFISVFVLAVAIFVVWLRPRDRSARLLALGMVGTAGVFNLQAQQTLEILPLDPLESFLQGTAHIIAGLAYVFALLLFPDGRPVPRWRAPWLAALYVPLTAGAVLFALRAGGTARPASLILFFGLAAPAAGVAAQGYRFRRAASPTEYQQARLLFWALLPALLVSLFFVVTRGLVLTETDSLAGRHIPDLPVIVFRVFQPLFAIIPIALFAGILRYRLWDIDRVINRTVVYGVLTASLAGVYFGIVVLLQRLFRPITGGSDLAVAGSTLAVAAAFRPARNWIQTFVDRRFYRQRYDAARTVEAFAARLREQIDLDTLTAELSDVVRQTMHPAHVSLWIRPARNDSETAAR